MDYKIIPLLVEILTELTQIRIALTTDLDYEDIAYYAAKMIKNKSFLSDVISDIKVTDC